MAKSNNLHSLYKFRESRFTSLSHELRVFIYGADVTPWLKGDLSVTYGNRDSFNNIVLEISNPRKLWQITRDNLAGNWRESIGEYSEKEKLSVFRWKNDPETNPAFFMEITRQVLGQKLVAKQASVSGMGPKVFVPAPSDAERRYRLAVNDCVFSRGDPMRVFMKNPYSTSSEEWVEIFCGFVKDHPITTNHLTGESTLRITGHCIREYLTKMRVQLNRDTGKIDPQPLFDKGFFSDFMDPSIATHPFSKSSLENTIKRLILGTATPKSGDTADPVNGIGAFKMGNVVCYDPARPMNTLERWHLMTLFGVNKVAFPNSADDNLWLTKKEMNDLGRTTIYLPDTYAQGPAGRYLHLLLPAGGTGAGTLVQATLDTAKTTIEWTTRWEIIRDFASKLDFQVTTSPSGDILVEFPMYGFTPHVFTTQGGVELSDEFVRSQETREEAAKKNEASVAKYNDDIDKGVIPYGLGSLLTFELHQVEDTLSDEAEDFPTILQVDGGASHTPENVEGKTEQLTAMRAYVYSPVLVSRFGVIAEQMSIPFAGQRDSDTSGGTDSPIAVRMANLALIEYMKRMADAATLDGTVIFRPFLFPNRPVWFKRSGRMGNLTSVTNRWTIGKSAGTSISMNMLLSERYDPETDTTIYRLPTGASNTPISYRSIWGENPKEAEQGDTKAGVIAKTGTKTPPSSSSNGGAGSVGSDKAATKSSSSPFAINSNAPYKYDDSTVMYAPFSAAIKEALELAKKQGFPPITVTSTYRHPAKQKAMKENPAAYGVARNKNGDFVQVAEPWSSCHQYGLALDISIEGDRLADYAAFADLCGDKIYWGGRYGDRVHYEWNAPPGGKTGNQANSFRQTLKLVEGNDPKDFTYLKPVWDYISSLSGNPFVTTPTGQAAATPDKPKGADTIGTNVQTPDICRPTNIPQTGLADMAAVANHIATLTRG